MPLCDGYVRVNILHDHDCDCGHVHDFIFYDHDDRDRVDHKSFFLDWNALHNTRVF